MNQYIASITCRCLLPSGSTKEVILGVVSPQPHEEFDFSCLVNLPDRDEPYKIYGVDSLQSLSLAMRFASARLDDLLSKGWVFFGRDGDDEYEIDWSAYFMPQSLLDKFTSIGENALNAIDAKIRNEEAEQGEAGQPPLAALSATSPVI
jgi:hypothetical protein